MKLLRQLIEALVLEGKFEHEVTQVSRKIIDTLKLRISKNGGYVRAFKFKVPAPDNVEAKSINVSVKRGKVEDIPTVSGDYTYDMDFQELDKNKINIYIEVPRSWEDFTTVLTHMSVILPSIKEILRHEFEHSREPAEELRRNSSYDPTKLDGVIRSYLDPAEVRAYVSGMYKHAKTAKKPLIDILTSRQVDIIAELKRAGANEDEAQLIVQTILDAWIAYVQKRFPSAQL